MWKQIFDLARQLLILTDSNFKWKGTRPMAPGSHPYEIRYVTAKPYTPRPMDLGSLSL